MESKHLAQTNRHLRIAGKVEEYLQRIANRPQPSHANAEFRRTECRISDSGQQVCQQHLLVETIQESQDTVRKRIPSDLSVFHLVFDRGIAHDRACDQLRKERYVKAHVTQIFLCRYPSIHIDHIAHRLERKEGNTNGQNDLCLWNCFVERREQCANVVGDKIHVLENEQNSEIDAHGQR